MTTNNHIASRERSEQTGVRVQQHTPGPWHRNIRAGGKYPTVFAGRNQHIAVACQQPMPAETEANIDLIAAAPEMLEALTRGHLYFLQCNNLSADDRAMLDEMWAAIQKARGGQ